MISLKNNTESQLVSVILLAYNQELFIRDAVEGLFSQTYTNLEIILSDDCSTDATFEILQEMASEYSGPHEIRLNRNDENLGLAGHFSYLGSVAKGNILVPAAGDDISLPSRVEETVALFEDGISAVSTGSVIFTDDVEGARVEARKIEEKHIQSYDITAYKSDEKFHLNGATRAYRSDVFNVFGAIDSSCPTEDSVFLLRSLLIGDVLTSSENLVLYRWHGNNLSSEVGITKMNFELIYKQYQRDLNLALELGYIDVELKNFLKDYFLHRCSNVNFNTFVNRYKLLRFKKLLRLPHRLYFKLKC